MNATFDLAPPRRRGAAWQPSCYYRPGVLLAFGSILVAGFWFDANKDGLLDAKEIEEEARWLNTHHKPGVPAKPKK